MNKFWLSWLVLVGAVSLFADTITTKSGDVINGTIKQIKGNHVFITTSFAGDLKVLREACETIVYTEDSPLYARTDATKREKTAVRLSHDAEGHPLLISRDDKAQAMALNDATTVWREGADDPDFPPIKLWAFSASVGATGHGGNSTDVNFSAYVDAVRTTEKTRLKLYASMNRTRSEHVNTAEQYIAGIDWEHRPWERHSWYFRDEGQNNRFNDYKLRNTVAAGYGLYLWNTTTENRLSCFRLRFGLAESHIEHYEPRPGGKTEDEVNLDIGLLFHYDFACGVKWNTEITYTPEFNDLSNASIIHETKFQYVFNKIWNISTEVGMRNEHQTEVSPGYCKTDTTWYIRLSKSW